MFLSFMLDSKTEKPTIESLIELQKKAQQRLPEAQEVTVYEASLIKYFNLELTQSNTQRLSGTFASGWI